MEEEDTEVEGDAFEEDADETGGEEVNEKDLNAELTTDIDNHHPEVEDEVVVDEDEDIVPNPLSMEIIAEFLSLLCKTGDGLSHAYVRLDIHGRFFHRRGMYDLTSDTILMDNCLTFRDFKPKLRDITDLDVLQSYIHLRYLDISKNSLKDISPINSLTHLLTLNADDNLLATAKLEEMPFLQVASFNNNRIVTTEGIGHPLLEHLSINNNRIKEIIGLESIKLTRLHTLELRGNKLQTTDGIYLPNLKNLYLGSNMISRIEGMSRLPGLITIHLRKNQIENLLGFSSLQTNLQYINLRENTVAKVREATKLSILPLLRALVLAENPCAELDDYRLETLIAIPTLERLDKYQFTDEERAEAEAISEQRRKEEQEKATLEAQILSEIEITEQAILEAEAEDEEEAYEESVPYGDPMTDIGDQIALNIQDFQ